MHPPHFNPFFVLVERHPIGEERRGEERSGEERSGEERSGEEWRGNGVESNVCQAPPPAAL